MTIACSITNSRLLITLCDRPRKHQLSDFFNTNEIFQQLPLWGHQKEVPGIEPNVNW